MPVISRFFGLVVAMYYNDHDPPHFHVRYGDHQALVAISDLRILAGGLPPRSFSIGGLVGEASVTVQYFTSKRLLLGLQVGYLRGLGSESEWSAAGITLKNGPSVTPQAFSVRLLVGGGGLSQRGE